MTDSKRKKKKSTEELQKLLRENLKVEWLSEIDDQDCVKIVQGVLLLVSKHIGYPEITKNRLLLPEVPKKWPE